MNKPRLLDDEEGLSSLVETEHGSGSVEMME